MLRAALLRASGSAALARQITQRPTTRRLALRFIAGESLEEGLGVARRLAAAGRSVTLDYLGEEVTVAAEARAAAGVIEEALRRMGAEGLPGGISVKPTQLGLRVDPTLCATLLAGVLHAADRVGAHVTLDMEGSDVTESTVALVEQVLMVPGGAAPAGGHGCAVQTALRRTPADVRRLTAAGASVRLCKGAYAETRALAHRRRALVDRAYATLGDWLLEHGTYPRLATHDHRLIARAQATACRLGRDRGTFEFQMLHGVRPSLQATLVRDGWPLCVYVPFGEQWYRYVVRRLAERPANVAFFLRSLRDT